MPEIVARFVEHGHACVQVRIPGPPDEKGRPTFLEPIVRVPLADLAEQEVEEAYTEEITEQVEQPMVSERGIVLANEDGSPKIEVVTRVTPVERTRTVRQPRPAEDAARLLQEAINAEVARYAPMPAAPIEPHPHQAAEEAAFALLDVPKSPPRQR